MSICVPLAEPVAHEFIATLKGNDLALLRF